MRIIAKEVLEFSERETDALHLVTEICTSLIREANDPNLKKLAAETYEMIAELWGREENEMY